MKHSKCITTALIILFNMSMSLTAFAGKQNGTMTVTLSPDERYDPKYYADAFLQSDEELPKAGLSDAERATFEARMVIAWEKMETTVNVTDLHIPTDTLGDLYFQTLYAHPEFFYLKNFYSFSCSGDTVISVKPSYTRNAATAATKKAELDAVVTQILSLISPEMQDYEKALIVHDWIALHCCYGGDTDDCFTAYGALVQHKAVCEGYSKAFVYILKNKLGIECCMVSSSAMNHAWNLVLLDGHYYHVDVTWDDPTPDLLGRVCHTYFMLNDASIVTAGGGGHEAGDKGIVADGTTYGNGQWKASESNMVYDEGKWYYIDNKGEKIKKTDDLLAASATSLGYDFPNGISAKKAESQVFA
ncbi:MAG: hypothetical protein J6P60_03680 [Lachnospiraceae bacterium]|nr:hypothetical protein [Lachnospiraceae bacterium]